MNKWGKWNSEIIKWKLKEQIIERSWEKFVTLWYVTVASLSERFSFKPLSIFMML